MKGVLKSKYIFVLLALLIGFLVGKNQGPEKVQSTEEIRKKESIISELQSRIESLKKEQLKENVKTVVVEKPDGTKVTTRTRSTERTTETAKLAEKEKSLQSNTELESKKKIVETFSSNHNAIGLRPSYRLFSEFETEVYLKAGMKCFIFECYAEGSYLILSKSPRAVVGIEYRF